MRESKEIESKEILELLHYSATHELHRFVHMYNMPKAKNIEEVLEYPNRPLRFNRAKIIKWKHEIWDKRKVKHEVVEESN